MQYFNKLIDKIDDIEDNFNIINSRIIEFGKSTDYKYIDFGLVNKYNKLLVSYLEFLEKQKNILLKNIDNDSSEEYKSIRELTEKRINILIKNIKNIKLKVQKIVDIKKENLTENEIKESFNSSSEMENLKVLLAEFKNDLKIYKKLQFTLGINIDLDDEIEKEIEKSNENEDIILKQKEYIEDYTDALEIIFKERRKRLDEIGARKEKLFKNIIEKNIYDNSFKEIFKSKYVVGLDLLDSDLNIDNHKFIKYNDDIDLFLDIAYFCNNYDLAIRKSKKYGLEELLRPFGDIKIFLENKILNSSNTNLKVLLDIINIEVGIGKLKNIFRYLDIFLSFLNLYEKINNLNYIKVDDYYNIGFISFFREGESLKNIISEIFKNYNIELLLKFRRENISIEKFNIFLNILNDEVKFLEKFKNAIVYLNRKVIYINYSTSLTSIKSEIKNQLEFYKGKYLYNELIAFYNKASKNKYKIARDQYYSNSSGGYSSGGYSSGGGGWSSGSSSGSSSYSSSGSSSW